MIEIIPCKRLYKETRIESHFWTSGKLFELRKVQAENGNWTNLGVYCILDDEYAAELNVHFIDAYVNYSKNPLIARCEMETSIERDITRFLRRA